MATVNNNYLKLPGSYLFSTIGRKVKEYEEAHPDARIVRLGIGDVTQPIAPAIIEALHKAVDEMGDPVMFKGYAPDLGYGFLREKIAENDYRNRGIDISDDEIFVSDGAKSDCSNIQEGFGGDNVIAVCDPVYPVYVDTGIMSGRAVRYVAATRENGFTPMPAEDLEADLIFICSPNNPTGAVYNKEQLKAWVDYALANDAVILFDSAYEAFISDPSLPRSIFAIEGARKCAIEFCSLSKTAGFTGTRCGYTVIPKALTFTSSRGTEMSLHAMWFRRQSTKFNGTSYIVQRGAAEVFTEEGMAQCRKNLAYYQENAKLISDTLSKHGIWFCGGTHSPYIWFECPNKMDSWDFFDILLNEAQVVGTPGAGFGDSGKCYFRLTAFGNHENTQEAMNRFEALLADKFSM